MDAAGWCAVADVLALTDLDRGTLEEMVRHNSKRRLQLEGDRIRACQGHSIEGMPVTLEGLEASWQPFEGEASIWHGTRLDALPAIRLEGLWSAQRSHVHLAATRDSSVGKRDKVAVLLEVDPARVRAADQPIFLAPNGVVLCRRVPAEAILAEHPITKRARRALSPPSR